jgi:hypothetical protein
MASNDLILSVDIGAWSLKIGEFEAGPDGLTMQQFGYSEYGTQMKLWDGFLKRMPIALRKYTFHFPPSWLLRVS